jgi:hypothetical protein
LTSVTFQSDSLLSIIGENAFTDSSLIQLTLPSHVSMISGSAFPTAFELNILPGNNFFNIQ